MRRHALPEQQTGFDETVKRRSQLRCRLAHHRSQQGVGELAPDRAPICATSLARPRRSSLAISEACKLAGTARLGDGIAAIVRAATLSLPASITALAISSANNGMPSVRS